MYGLIISGGTGTRLWPLSRADNPKQLQSFTGSPHSLLQSTFARLERTIAPEQIKIVTSSNYSTQLLDQIHEVSPGYPAANLLCEPVGRDSAPAILWGALELAEQAPDDVAAVIWSDAMIRRESEFDRALAHAEQVAQQGALVAIGIKPTYPATGLGYIQAGAAFSDGAFDVERFIEKPDAETAARLLTDGRHSWNAGIFVFHLGTLLAEFERLAPDMMACFRAQMGNGKTWNSPEAIKSIYDSIRKESLDYAVLVKTNQLKVVNYDLNWSDLGAWDIVHAESPRDEAGNSATGAVYHVDSRNTYVHSPTRLVATIGVENLVIVNTDDALLVCDMSRVQNVKELVEQLRKAGRTETELSATTVRPWGSFTVLSAGPGYQLKIIEVNPHHKLSLQKHAQRAEHWVVMDGRAWVTLDDRELVLEPNEHVFIPIGAVHRMDNRADEPLRIIEVQFGEYLGEDDIVRIEDSYGRA